ncbi:hypothetical protein BX616_001573 [Lobosporangium transversale]|nr:hypothetical protein BX616_001573 [Lobosporangium transversale]
MAYGFPRDRESTRGPCQFKRASVIWAKQYDCAHAFTIQAGSLMSLQMHPSCTEIIGFLSKYLAMLSRKDAMIVEINSEFKLNCTAVQRLADSQVRGRLSLMHEAIMLSEIVKLRSLGAFAVYTDTTVPHGGLKPMMIVMV